MQFLFKCCSNGDLDGLKAASVEDDELRMVVDKGGNSLLHRLVERAHTDTIPSDCMDIYIGAVNMAIFI